VSDEIRLHFILQYGLYGAFFGSFLYIILGSCKDVAMGPTAVVSLLTYQHAGHLGDYAYLCAILLNFLAGCIELAMGILQLGKCTNFVLPCQNVLHYLPPLSIVDVSVVDTASLKND
jgi:MFS superfamily sulfate permease-like transporter